MPPIGDQFVEVVSTHAPRVGLAFVVLAAGWLVARLAKRLAERSLQILHFDEAAERSGIDDFLVRGGVRLTARSILATFVYWTVLAVSAVGCFTLMGVPESRVLVANIFSFGVRALLAAVIVTFGIAFAGMVRGAVAAYLNNLGIEGARPLGVAAQVAVILFVASLALEQLNMGSQIIVVGFSMIFGGACLALAIAFGLGGRKWAEKFLDKWMN